MTSSLSQLAKASSINRPVVVLLGGTSGIGIGTARALTKAFNGNIHLIFSARSKSNAELAIKSLGFDCVSSEVLKGIQQDDERSMMATRTIADFIQSDATNVKSMKSLADQIKALGIDKINFLVLSCWQLISSGSERTDEGVERKLAMNFYSRFALAYHLLPLLQSCSTTQSEPSVVLSILAPGRGGPISTADYGLPLEATRSGSSLLLRLKWLRETEKAGVVYNDFMTEWFASMQGNEKVGFIHNYPGFVDTGSLRSSNRAVRAIFQPLLKLIAISEDASGEYMAASLLQPSNHKGPHFLGPKGQPISLNSPTAWPELPIGSKGREEAKEKLFQHLKQVGGF